MINCICCDGRYKKTLMGTFDIKCAYCVADIVNGIIDSDLKNAYLEKIRKLLISPDIVLVKKIINEKLINSSLK